MAARRPFDFNGTLIGPDPIEAAVTKGALARGQRQRILSRQRLLRAKGYVTAVDGNWGPVSQMAWSRYRRGLPPITAGADFAPRPAPLAVQNPAIAGQSGRVGREGAPDSYMGAPTPRQVDSVVQAQRAAKRAAFLQKKAADIAAKAFNQPATDTRDHFIRQDPVFGRVPTEVKPLPTTIPDVRTVTQKKNDLAVMGMQAAAKAPAAVAEQVDEIRRTVRAIMKRSSATWTTSEFALVYGTDFGPKRWWKNPNEVKRVQRYLLSKGAKGYYYVGGGSVGGGFMRRDPLRTDGVWDPATMRAYFHQMRVYKRADFVKRAYALRRMYYVPLGLHEGEAGFPVIPGGITPSARELLRILDKGGPYANWILRALTQRLHDPNPLVLHIRDSQLDNYLDPTAVFRGEDPRMKGTTSGPGWSTPSYKGNPAMKIPGRDGYFAAVDNPGFVSWRDKQIKQVLKGKGTIASGGPATSAQGIFAAPGFLLSKDPRVLAMQAVTSIIIQGGYNDPARKGDTFNDEVIAIAHSHSAPELEKAIEQVRAKDTQMWNYEQMVKAVNDTFWGDIAGAGGKLLHYLQIPSEKTTYAYEVYWKGMGQDLNATFRGASAEDIAANRKFRGQLFEEWRKQHPWLYMLESSLIDPTNLIPATWIKAPFTAGRLTAEALEKLGVRLVETGDQRMARSLLGEALKAPVKSGRAVRWHVVGGGKVMVRDTLGPTWVGSAAKSIKTAKGQMVHQTQLLLDQMMMNYFDIKESALGLGFTARQIKNIEKDWAKIQKQVAIETESGSGEYVNIWEKTNDNKARSLSETTRQFAVIIKIFLRESVSLFVHEARADRHGLGILTDIGAAIDSMLQQTMRAMYAQQDATREAWQAFQASKERRLAGLEGRARTVAAERRPVPATIEMKPTSEAQRIGVEAAQDTEANAIDAAILHDIEQAAYADGQVAYDAYMERVGSSRGGGEYKLDTDLEDRVQVHMETVRTTIFPAIQDVIEHNVEKRNLRPGVTEENKFRLFDKNSKMYIHGNSRLIQQMVDMSREGFNEVGASFGLSAEQILKGVGAHGAVIKANLELAEAEIDEAARHYIDMLQQDARLFEESVELSNIRPGEQRAVLINKSNPKLVIPGRPGETGAALFARHVGEQAAKPEATLKEFRDVEQAAAEAEARVEEEFGEVTDFSTFTNSQWENEFRVRGYTEEEIRNFQKWIDLNKRLGFHDSEYPPTPHSPLGPSDQMIISKATPPEAGGWYHATAEFGSSDKTLTNLTPMPVDEAGKPLTKATGTLAGQVPAEDLPPLAPDHVRLYRGEGLRTSAHVNLPDWIAENRGRWFTTDRAFAESYARSSGGEVRWVDVPDDVAKLSMVHEGDNFHQATEFVLPKEYANQSELIRPVAPTRPSELPPAEAPAVPFQDVPAPAAAAAAPAVATRPAAAPQVDEFGDPIYDYGDPGDVAPPAPAPVEAPEIPVVAKGGKRPRVQVVSLHAFTDPKTGEVFVPDMAPNAQSSKAIKLFSDITNAPRGKGMSARKSRKALKPKLRDDTADQAVAADWLQEERDRALVRWIFTTERRQDVAGNLEHPLEAGEEHYEALKRLVPDNELRQQMLDNRAEVKTRGLEAYIGPQKPKPVPRPLTEEERRLRAQRDRQLVGLIFLGEGAPSEEAWEAFTRLVPEEKTREWLYGHRDAIRHWRIRGAGKKAVTRRFSSEGMQDSYLRRQQEKALRSAHEDVARQKLAARAEARAEADLLADTSKRRTVEVKNANHGVVFTGQERADMTKLLEDRKARSVKGWASRQAAKGRPVPVGRVEAIMREWAEEEERMWAEVEGGFTQVDEFIRVPAVYARHLDNVWDDPLKGMDPFLNDPNRSQSFKDVAAVAATPPDAELGAVPAIVQRLAATLTGTTFKAIKTFPANAATDAAKTVVHGGRPVVFARPRPATLGISRDSRRGRMLGNRRRPGQKAALDMSQGYGPIGNIDPLGQSWFSLMNEQQMLLKVLAAHMQPMLFRRQWAPFLALRTAQTWKLKMLWAGVDGLMNIFTTLVIPLSVKTAVRNVVDNYIRIMSQGHYDPRYYVAQLPTRYRNHYVKLWSEVHFDYVHNALRAARRVQIKYRPYTGYGEVADRYRGLGPSAEEVRKDPRKSFAIAVQDQDNVWHYGKPGESREEVINRLGLEGGDDLSHVHLLFNRKTGAVASTTYFRNAASAAPVASQAVAEAGESISRRRDRELVLAMLRSDDPPTEAGKEAFKRLIPDDRKRARVWSVRHSHDVQEFLRVRQSTRPLAKGSTDLSALNPETEIQIREAYDGALRDRSKRSRAEWDKSLRTLREEGMPLRKLPREALARQGKLVGLMEGNVQSWPRLLAMLEDGRSDGFSVVTIFSWGVRQMRAYLKMQMANNPNYGIRLLDEFDRLVAGFWANDATKIRKILDVHGIDIPDSLIEGQQMLGDFRDFGVMGKKRGILRLTPEVWAGLEGLSGKDAQDWIRAGFANAEPTFGKGIPVGFGRRVGSQLAGDFQRTIGLTTAKPLADKALQQDALYSFLSFSRDAIWDMMVGVPEGTARVTLYRASYARAYKRALVEAAVDWYKETNPDARQFKDVGDVHESRAVKLFSEAGRADNTLFQTARSDATWKAQIAGLKEVEKTLFDYDQVTVAEDNIRLLAPFAFYWRKTLPFWAKKMARNPWMPADMQRLEQAQLQDSENKGEPPWMARYVPMNWLTDSMAKVPVVNWLFPSFDGVKVSADPMNLFSGALAYKLFKGQNESLPPDEAGMRFLADIADTINGSGLALTPWFRKPLEWAGVFNYRAWQDSFPQASYMETWSQQHLNEVFPNGVNVEQVFEDSIFKALHIDVSAGKYNRQRHNIYVQRYIAQEMVGGHLVTRAEAETAVNRFLYVSNSWGFFSSLYPRDMSPELVRLYQIIQALHDQSIDFQDLKPEEQVAYQIFKRREWNPVAFNHYLEAVPKIEAYHAMEDYDKGQAFLQENPEIIQYVNRAYNGGKLFARQGYKKTIDLMVQGENAFRVSKLLDDVDLSYDQETMVRNIFVTPELKRFWDQNDTPKEVRDNMAKGAVHAYTRSLTEMYFALPDTDYDAKAEFLKQNPILQYEFQKSNSSWDDLMDPFNNMAGDLRNHYGDLLDAEKYNEAEKFLREHPWIFKFTKAAGRVTDDGIMISKKYGPQQRADYVEAYNYLQKYFRMRGDGKYPTKAAQLWIASDDYGAKLVRAYFEKWGNFHGFSAEHSRDYLKMKPLLVWFHDTLPDKGPFRGYDSKWDWMEESSDKAAKALHAYFRKYGKKGGSTQHSRDYLKNEKWLKYYWDLSKTDKEAALAWLHSGKPEAEDVRAYFKTYGKFTMLSRKYSKWVRSMNPEIDRRNLFWHRYFALSPDKRPAFVHAHAEEYGVFIYGPIGVQDRADQEAHYLRMAKRKHLTAKVALRLRIAPLLDTYNSLTDPTEKRLFERANPDMMAWLDKYGKGALTGNKALDKKVAHYFSMDPDSAERSEYLRRHPEVQQYFDLKNPADAAVHRLLEVYFSLTDSREKQDFLLQHHEINDYFDRKKMEKQNLADMTVAFDEADPRLEEYRVRMQSEILDPAKAMFTDMRRQVAGNIAGDTMVDPRSGLDPRERKHRRRRYGVVLGP